MQYANIGSAPPTVRWCVANCVVWGMSQELDVSCVEYTK